MQRHSSSTLGFLILFCGEFCLFLLRAREIFLFCKTVFCLSPDWLPKRQPCPPGGGVFPAPIKGLAPVCCIVLHSQWSCVREGPRQWQVQDHSESNTNLSWLESVVKRRVWRANQSACTVSFESLRLSLGSGRCHSAAAVLSPSVSAAEAMARVLCAAFSDAGRSTCWTPAVWQQSVQKPWKIACHPSQCCDTPFMKRADASANSEWFEKRVLNWSPVGRNMWRKMWSLWDLFWSKFRIWILSLWSPISVKHNQQAVFGHLFYSSQLESILSVSLIVFAVSWRTFCTKLLLMTPQEEYLVTNNVLFLAFFILSSQVW